MRAGGIREATSADAAGCAAVYRPYVTDTAVSFELEPPSPAEMAARIAAAYAWLVAEQHGEVVGYAYGGPFRSRPAYRWTCEVSVYLAGPACGHGLGRALYTALFPRLAARGLRTATAATTLPNDASVALHRKLGFETVGTFRRVGWKLGAWHDVLWLQRALVPPEVAGLPPNIEL